MSRHHATRPLSSAILLTLLAAGVAPGQERGVRPSFEEALHQGRLADAERLMVAAQEERPEDDDVRFALGVTRFLRAVEGRIQALYRHGFLASPGGLVSFSNLPIPKNPKPEPLDYKAARGLLQAWIDDLARVEETLAKVKAPDVKLPLHFGLIRLDFDGDGRAGADESLW